MLIRYELGLTLEGEQTVEGPSVGKLIGLEDARATLAMLRTSRSPSSSANACHARLSMSGRSPEHDIIL